MHQALYRKWRPKTFDEVYGQEHITSVLKYEISEGRLSHAYLFCGSRGTGKTSCAKLLSKAVNCENPRDGSPCGECAACRAIDAGTATDVLEMDAASNNGVDYIRDIREEVVYTPAELKYRVYIVDEVHMLSSGAFNALLKTLEEPPSHVIFVLATTELHKLPATIISRCQRFDFRRIASPVIAEQLLRIAQEEQIVLEADAAAMIARLSRGGMRDAISMLELCSGTPAPVTLATVEDALGVSSRDSVLRLVRAVSAHDLGAAFGVIAEISSSAVDVSVFWQSLTEFYRDLLVVKTSENAATYLELLPQEENECRELAARFTLERLVCHAGILDAAASRMQRNSASRRLEAELALVRMCDESLDDGREALAARVAELEERVALLSAGSVAPVAPVAETKKNEKKKAAAEMAATADIQPVEAADKPVLRAIGAWPETVDRISKKNKAVGSFLSGASAFSDGENCLIRVGSSFFAGMLSTQENRSLLADALSLSLGCRISPERLKIEHTEQQKGQDDDILSQIN